MPAHHLRHIDFIRESEIADIIACDLINGSQDCIRDDGQVNPDGHQVITSCGDVVCVHCLKVFP